ncbi:MAG: glycerol dehydrogenase [Spirochaetes bacterium]|nr:glycerol dehydrogenase [Spirochaetota bacterium]
MTRIMIAPNRYIQGPDIIKDTAEYISHLGKKIFLICGSRAMSVVKDLMIPGFNAHSIDYKFEIFTGECNRAAAAGLSQKAKEFGADIIAGVGGGRAIDTAKAVFHELDSTLVIIPTIASNDAPCSALSVQYADNHIIDRFLILKRNPDVVLVDSAIIADSPARFFSAGMGDALATWFEAYSCSKSGTKNHPGGMPPAAALSIARLCYDTLMEFGYEAFQSVEQKEVTPALENVIEANILLSGLGFESGGVAVAHGMQDGINALDGTESFLHGELVAFGTITQLVLEKYPEDEIERVIAFCNSVGLPVTLGQLGVTDLSEKNLMKAAEISCGEGMPTHNTHVEVNPEIILKAMIEANMMGEASLK